MELWCPPSGNVLVIMVKLLCLLKKFSCKSCGLLEVKLALRTCQFDRFVNLKFFNGEFHCIYKFFSNYIYVYTQVLGVRDIEHSYLAFWTYFLFWAWLLTVSEKCFICFIFSHFFECDKLCFYIPSYVIASFLIPFCFLFMFPHSWKMISPSKLFNEWNSEYIEWKFCLGLVDIEKYLSVWLWAIYIRPSIWIFKLSIFILSINFNISHEIPKLFWRNIWKKGDLLYPTQKTSCPCRINIYRGRKKENCFLKSQPAFDAFRPPTWICSWLKQAFLKWCTKKKNVWPVETMKAGVLTPQVPK